MVHVMCTCDGACDDACDGVCVMVHVWLLLSSMAQMPTRLLTWLAFLNISTLIYTLSIDFIRFVSSIDL